MTNKNKEISLSFLIAGHTKFAPDRGFGLLKRKYRKMKVDCLTDLQKMVEGGIVRLRFKDKCCIGTSSKIWNTFLNSIFVLFDGFKKVNNVYTMAKPLKALRDLNYSELQEVKAKIAEFKESAKLKKYPAIYAISSRRGKSECHEFFGALGGSSRKKNSRL